METPGAEFGYHIDRSMQGAVKNLPIGDASCASRLADLSSRSDRCTAPYFFGVAVPNFDAGQFPPDSLNVCCAECSKAPYG